MSSFYDKQVYEFVNTKKMGGFSVLALGVRTHNMY